MFRVTDITSRACVFCCFVFSGWRHIFFSLISSRKDLFSCLKNPTQLFSSGYTKHIFVVLNRSDARVFCERGPGFNPDPRHTKDVIQIVPNASFLSVQHYKDISGFSGDEEFFISLRLYLDIQKTHKKYTKLS